MEAQEVKQLAEVGFEPSNFSGEPEFFILVLHPRLHTLGAL